MTLPVDPIANLVALVRCRSVTPAEGGALSALEAMVAPLGLSVERPIFEEAGEASVENLYARLGTEGPHLMFAGHTDVVPPGNEASWTHPPFEGTIADGVLYGRGAVDMKGGIACFVAALARYVKKHGRPKGSVSLLITGDEEGPAVNGTVKLLEWAAQKGETWDAAVVGEPTCPNELGDMIKIGRRGSLTGQVTVYGKQGHVAYPHLADNPVRGLTTLAAALLDPALDSGTPQFPATNLEITTVDVGNPASNVIPAQASLVFNIRFNDTWSVETLKAEIEKRLTAAAQDRSLRPGKESPIQFELVWKGVPCPVFLTHDEKLINTLSSSIAAVTGKTPELSTTGGTSDARFIKSYCPVVEFGLVGQTMHMVDERVAVADLELLTQVYLRFLEDWFA